MSSPNDPMKPTPAAPLPYSPGLAGVIAGDALFAFFTSTWKATFK